MKNQNVQSLLNLLRETHSEEWEATPLTQDAIHWLTELLDFLFPNNTLPKDVAYESILKKNQIDLENILVSYWNPIDSSVHAVVEAFYDSLKTIYQNLRLDAAKIYENDPAATSIHEVIVSYPGFYAIAVYRIANKLTQLQVPILPRILSEYAHSKTGVDIHPTASIDVPFFIDHGTGIVIGGTSTIGKNVSIYQGVTLGALYVNKDLSDTKRHPTIEDNVVIYARTTILGGKTVIGKNSMIGGSVFLTKSVAPGSRVFNTHKLRILSEFDNIPDDDIGFNI